MNVAEALAAAERELFDGEIAEPRKEAASLLAYALGKDRTFLIAHPEYELRPEQIQHYSGSVRRRASREPFQYITGKQEFFGLEFDVTPAVLIPRPETEMIVEASLEILAGKDSPTICEVGTGSGCIAISIIHALPEARALALDISADALAVAAANAAKLAAADRVRFLRSDVFNALGEERFDLVVSNPPYVPAADLDGLQSEVRDFEPVIALTDGGSGISIIERLISGAPAVLKPRGHLLVEIGFGQAEAVRRLFDPATWAEIDILPDLRGIPRMVKAHLK